MLPRLYQTIDNFDTKNGYGFFNGCSKCEVTTEENGEYYCDLNLNPDDRLANTITPGQIVKAKANSKDNPQLFEVNNVEIDKNGYVTAKCAHIKEWFLNLTTDGGGVVGDIDNPYWFTGTAQQIVDEVMSNISTQHRFSITVTGFGNTQKTLKIGFEDPTSLADIFFSDEGLVNLFGGFVKFDNFSVSFQKVSGTVTQKEIRYGSSISEYNQVINNDNVYSKVYGLAKFEWEYNPYDRGKYQEISRGSIVDVPNTTSITNKTLIIDVSNKLRKKKYTNEELSDAENEVSAATSGYVQNYLTELSEPKVTIRITYRETLDSLTVISLGDILTVSYSPQLLTHRDRISKTLYDSINERYNEIQIGDKIMTLTAFINLSGRR